MASEKADPEEPADPFPLATRAPAATNLSTLDIAGFPQSFEQIHLLTAGKFADEAKKRGFLLRAGQPFEVAVLEELHQHGVLVPLYRVDPAKADQVGDADLSYRCTDVRVLRRGIEAGWATDPACEDFQPWNGSGEYHLYSVHQLIALDQAHGYIEVLEPFRASDHTLRWRLPKHYQPTEMEKTDTRRARFFFEGLSTWRALAVTLAAIDSVYWPLMVRRVRGDLASWRAARLSFDPHGTAELLGVTLEALRSQVIALRVRATVQDSLGDFYDLVRRADPGKWESLKGDARLAMDYRLAADVLERFANDLDPEPTTKPNLLDSVTSQSLAARRDSLDHALTTFDLSPHPSVVVGVEGPTELMLVPLVMELMGIEPDPSWIRIECFEGVGANLALMARYAVRPLLGTDYGDWVAVERPPSRFLVLTDAEGKYTTRDQRLEQRQNLIDAIAWSLPTDLRPDLYKRGTRLVEIMTWGRLPFEFAHFTDEQLADALLACAKKSHPKGRDGLVRAVAMQRNFDPAPDIERVWASSGVDKLAVAEATWPLLEARVRNAIKRGWAGPPIMRGIARAYELAIHSPRANMALRRHKRGRSVGR